MVVVLATFAATCGGGSGKDAVSDLPLPTGPTNSGTPTATGDPSNGDFIELSAQLMSMASGQLVQALSGSAGVQSIGPMTLQRPAQTVTQTAAFFCCGPQSTTSTSVVMTTSITVPPSTGALGILQTIGQVTEPQWISTVANGWRIDLSKLRITGDAETTGNTVNASQQLRLSGTFTYTIPNSATKSVSVDILFRYADLQTSIPRATGQIGPATVTDHAANPLIPPTRCSRPREGCGSTVSGDHPCTVWPLCPAS
jgi:hypothetical protein